MNENRTPRYNDLKVVPGRKNWYRNPINKKLTFKKRGVKISTGLTQILKAEQFVQAELARRHGKPETNIKKRLHGVPNPLIKDVWELLLEDKKAESKPNTIRAYKKNWRVGMEPFWGSKYASDVTGENLAEYKRWYLAKHSTRSFEKTEIQFKWLLKGMNKSGYLAELPDLSILANVDELVTKAAKRPKVGRVLKANELEALFEAAAKYSEGISDGTTAEHKQLLGLRAELGVMLAAKCGMRKMEAMGLEWEKIDLRSGIAKVWSDKNHNWRDVPLIPKLVEIFRRQHARTGAGRYVFPMPSDSTRHISGQVFDKVWIKVKEDAEIKGRLRFHDLRHTFASMTADAGWPPKVACEILDMSLAIYDKIYAKASAEKKMEWVNRTFGETDE